MKTNAIKRGIILLFTMLFSTTMVLLAQDDSKKKAAKEAADKLTTEMIKALELTEEQSDSIADFNQAYALSLFTTVALTDEDIETIDASLDTNVKGILTEDQYAIWGENKESWLKAVKDKIPKEELPDIL
ncbi:hypothetical protein [Dysgonomonas sp. Marseille-P4361]|uniref:hypothetical protein n=1 Tax=Dysgonomonas sp. Marseille-P4361 TaxID=2161820 RepID=UPI000D55BB1E|nr:hypothetical protein [Dysgonomonas sp. Marseille-P4361]